MEGVVREFSSDGRDRTGQVLLANSLLAIKVRHLLYRGTRVLIGWRVRAYTRYSDTRSS